ncbi:MAG TPA: response regulator FixJ [Bauldia sp.]|nr:response regulator FixJ [Bauldia sp.]
MAADAVVHVIDDDQAVRDSLSFLLATAGLTVRVFDGAGAFLDALPSVEPGCVVTDVRMPGMSGIELMPELAKRGVTLPVIVITGHGDVPLAVEAMKLGAFDFIEKPFEDDTIIASVRAALAKHATSGRDEGRKGEVLARLATLSQRERQVLDGLVAGHPNKVIAYDLGISPRTVEVYRANVMSKTGASSLSDLVRMTIIAGPG